MNPLRHKMDLGARLAEARRENQMSGYLREQLRVLDEILSGKPYYGTTYYIPGEILALFDMVSVYMERITGFGAANRMFNNLSLLKAKHNFPAAGCSYQLFFNCMVEEGIIPVPAGFIGASYACDDAWAYCRGASVRYGVPFYFIDVTQSDGEFGLEYLARQLEHLYRKLKGDFNQIYSIDEVADKSNEALKVKREIDGIRFHYPGIYSSSEGFKFFTLYNDLGRGAAVDIFTTILEDLKKKIPDYVTDNFPRILWLGIIPLYRNRIIEEIERDYECRIVYEEMSEYGDQYLSADGFFTDLARRIISSIFFSDFKRMAAIKKYIESMNIKGVIHFSQRNCRFLPPMFPVLSRKLSEMGVPCVELSGDAVDPAYYTENRYKDRLDAFFELLCFKN